MATYNQEVMRHERSKTTGRLRDFVVMAAFSLAALLAAFAFVQYKYAAPPEPMSSEIAAQPADVHARPQEQSARTSIQRAALTMEVPTEALSEVRAALERTRADLEAAVARVNRLEAAVRKLEAAPGGDRPSGPNTPAPSGAELSAGAEAAPAAQPAPADGNGATMKDAARVEGEEAVPSYGKQDQYGVTNGKALQDPPRPLPPPRKPASPRL